MFGRSNDGNGNNDDHAIGPPMTAPDVPPLRTWDVTLRQGEWSERRVVEAHDIDFTPDGSIIRWATLYKDERGMPGSRVSLTIFRPVDGWVEYSERVPEPTSILLPPTGGGVTLQ